MRAWRIGLLAALLAGSASCSEESSPTVGTTASTTSSPAPVTALGQFATCAEYLKATPSEREVSTRAALIVARQGDGGVRTTPSGEQRALFEIAVGLECDRNPSARMLTVMAAVIASDSSYVD